MPGGPERRRGPGVRGGTRRSSSSRSTSCAASGRVPAEGLTRRTMPLVQIVCARARPRLRWRTCGSRPASTRSSWRWRTRARRATSAASRCSTPRPRPSGEFGCARGHAADRASARRSCRRCAGGWPRCRSGSTIRTGSRRPRSTSATTCARWRWPRRAPTSSSPTRWRGSCRARSTARGRCGSST